MATQESRVKSIVKVVFQYDVDTLRPHPTAQEYTYFCTFPIKVGDFAFVNSSQSRSIVGVVVTSVEPSTEEIRRATKALLGTVDVSAHRACTAAERAKAVTEAWDRFEAGGV